MALCTTNQLPFIANENWAYAKTNEFLDASKNVENDAYLAYFFWNAYRRDFTSNTSVTQGDSNHVVPGTETYTLPPADQVSVFNVFETEALQKDYTPHMKDNRDSFCMLNELEKALQTDSSILNGGVLVLHVENSSLPSHHLSDMREKIEGICNAHPIVYDTQWSTVTFVLHSLDKSIHLPHLQASMYKWYTNNQCSILYFNKTVDYKGLFREQTHCLYSTQLALVSEINNQIEKRKDSHLIRLHTFSYADYTPTQFLNHVAKTIGVDTNAYLDIRLPCMLPQTCALIAKSLLESKAHFFFAMSTIFIDLSEQNAYDYQRRIITQLNDLSLVGEQKISVKCVYFFSNEISESNANVMIRKYAVALLARTNLRYTFRYVADHFSTLLPPTLPSLLPPSPILPSSQLDKKKA
jgi:hypothetical protein